MTSDVHSVCALTRDRRGKGKHVCSIQCTSQERETGASACRENADDIWLNDVTKGEAHVTELLQFVSLVSSDIKTALSRSYQSKRNVDHRKYLQRQLSRLTSVPSDSFVLHNIKSSGNVSQSDCTVFNAVSTYDDINEIKSKRIGKSCAKSKMHNRSSDVKKQTELSAITTGDAFVGISNSVRSGSENCTEQTFNKNDTLSSSEGHFHRHSSTLKQLYSSANYCQASTLCRGESFDKQDVPLRQRQLPASFWQEPNVPRFQFDNGCFHGFSFNLQEQTESYRVFLERFQMAQRHRHNSRSSQFPITDFLYHKYGIKDNFCSYPSGDTLLQHPRFSADLKTIGSFPTYPGKEVANSYTANGFPNISSELPNRSWDFVLGKWPSGFEMLHAPVWKPVATKTLTLGTNRYHPF